MIVLGVSEPSFAEDPGVFLIPLLYNVGRPVIFAFFAWSIYRLIRPPNYQDLIDNWCRNRGLRMLGFDRRWFWKGPFFLSSNNMAVFYVSVQDQSGREKHMWVRCGHWFFGMLRPEVAVREA